MENVNSLAGKVAVVTGGSSGIGAASVRLLAAAGARVVVGYNKGADRAAALIGELPGSGHQAMYLPMEDTAQIRKVADAVKGQQFEIIQTNLSKEQEDKLRADFGE